MSKYFEKKSDDSFLLHVHVKPNSKKQDIIDNEEYLTILIRSKAIQNRANKELLNLLKKKLNISSNQIEILKGSKTPKKLIQIKFNGKLDEQKIINNLLI